MRSRSRHRAPAGLEPHCRQLHAGRITRKLTLDGSSPLVWQLSYNSHTTGSDSLWSGLPMLTQSGRYFAARVAGALAFNVGLPQLQVSSLKAYEDTIHLLARPSERADARRWVGAMRAERLPPARRPSYRQTSAHAKMGASFAPEVKGRFAQGPLHGTSALSVGGERPGAAGARLVGPRPWGEFLRYETIEQGGSQAFTRVDGMGDVAFMAHLVPGPRHA